MASPGTWRPPHPPHIHPEPFQRSDTYGTYCQNARSLATNLRLVVVCATVVPIKMVLAVACLVSYYVAVKFGTAFLKDPYQTLFLAYWAKFWTRALLYVLGFWYIKWVYVSPDGSQSTKAPEGLQERNFGAYVSNHASWVDIILYMSRLAPSFVAKKAVASLPLVGPISGAIQCLYVDRERRLAPAEAAAAAAANNGVAGEGMAQLVTDRIRAKSSNPRSSARHLLLFPEGTTSNNKFMLAFKRGAFIAGAPVQPLVLKYGPSKRFSPTWDAMPGGLHILLTLTELVHRVTVYQLPLYVPSDEERADPALYANNVREMMSKYGKIPTCELTYAEKLQYLKWVEATIKEEDAAKKGKGKREKAAADVGPGAGAGEEQGGGRVLAGGRVDSGSLRVRVTGVTRKSMVDGEGAEVGSPRSGGERVQVHAKAL